LKYLRRKKAFASFRAIRLSDSSIIPRCKSQPLTTRQIAS